MMDAALLNWNPFGDDEPLPGETLMADGWRYQDFNPMLGEYWEQILGVIGEGNYRLITYAERTFKDDPRLYKRGQILIAPSGFDNLRAYAANRKN
jgi:hypothetical protein